jgi:isoleucyl-tRNA synthetase
MGAARQLVELGRRIRVETRTRTRQPLLEAVIHTAGRRGGLDDLLDVVADELNVKTVRFAESTDAFGRWRAKPDFKVLGPRLGPRVKSVAAALAADGGDLAGALARGEEVTVAVDDGPPVSLGPVDVELAQEVLEGWGVASDAGVTVALELTVTPELKSEGLARELVRVVQDARKAAGLDVTDRIALGVLAGGEVAVALARYRDYVSSETLAVELRSTLDEGTSRQDADIDGEPVAITVRRV